VVKVRVGWVWGVGWLGVHCSDMTGNYGCGKTRDKRARKDRDGINTARKAETGPG